MVTEPEKMTEPREVTKPGEEPCLFLSFSPHAANSAHPEPEEREREHMLSEQICHYLMSDGRESACNAETGSS